MISNSPDETRKIAEELGKSLKPKDIISLYGELGAGKTTFVAGLASGLKIKDCITSPSFIIIDEYSNAKIPFYHIDLYRMENQNDIKDLAIESILEREAVVAIEWAERLGGGILPDRRIDVMIEYVDETKRKIEIIRR